MGYVNATFVAGGLRAYRQGQDGLIDERISSSSIPVNLDLVNKMDKHLLI